MKIKDAIEVCLGSITGKFETGGRWDKVTDNFDGFGPSVGIIQFAWGQGSLQEVIRIFMKDNFLADYFNFEEAKNITEALNGSIERQRLLASSEWFSGKTWKNIDVEEGFGRMAKSPGFKRAQIEGVRYYATIAEMLFQTGNFESVRAFAVFFDIAVQNGGIKKEDRVEAMNKIREIELNECRAMTEVERLKVWIDVRVSKASERWREDVRTRKYAILNDGGTVRGTRYSFASLCLDEKLELA